MVKYKKHKNREEMMEIVVAVFGGITVFFIAGVFMCWWRTWRRVDRIFDEIKRDADRC